MRLTYSPRGWLHFIFCRGGILGVFAKRGKMQDQKPTNTLPKSPEGAFHIWRNAKFARSAAPGWYGTRLWRLKNHNALALTSLCPFPRMRLPFLPVYNLRHNV
jgi:hypothetical protein